MRAATSLVVLGLFVPVAVEAQPIEIEVPGGPQKSPPPPAFELTPPPPMRRSVPLMATGGVFMGAGALLLIAGLGVTGDGVAGPCSFGARCNDEASPQLIGVIVIGVAALHLAVGGLLLGLAVKLRPPSQSQHDLALEHRLRLTEPEVAAGMRRARRMVMGGGFGLALSSAAIMAGGIVLNFGTYYTGTPGPPDTKLSLTVGGATTLGIGVAALAASAAVLGIGVRRGKELRSSYELAYGHGGSDGTVTIAPWGATSSGGLSMAGTF